MFLIGKRKKLRLPQKKSDYRFSPQAGQNGKSSSTSASHDAQTPLGTLVCSVKSSLDDNKRTDFSWITGVTSASVRISHAAVNAIASCSADSSWISRFAKLESTSRDSISVISVCSQRRNSSSVGLPMNYCTSGS